MLSYKTTRTIKKPKQTKSLFWYEKMFIALHNAKKLDSFLSMSQD